MDSFSMSFFKNTYPRFGDFFVEKYKLGKI